MPRGRLLSEAQENAIFKIKQHLRGGGMGGPSWSSLARKYGVSIGTVQNGWARANGRMKRSGYGQW